MRRPANAPPSLTAPEGRVLLGSSPAMQRLRQRIQQVAPTEATVLIRGERGTGKELVADAIVAASRRRDRPYVKVNCAALPAELLAAELFGHERGSFTGAFERRRGLLAAADGGTVFLDEIGDLSPQGQAMLLRFLQEREVRPVGSVETARVDARVIAATNRDVEAAAERGEFRADLYDRLREVVVTVPALRTRNEDDVVLLAEHFTALHARRHGMHAPDLTPAARRRLLTHDWPGNVRELELTMSQAVIHATGRWMRAEDLALPARRQPPTGAATGTDTTSRQAEVLRLVSIPGGARCSDIAARLGLCREAARRELAGLLEAGLLLRLGRGRATRYLPERHREPPPADEPLGLFFRPGN